MLSDQAEGRELHAGDGRVVLGALIKSGGAGSVYRVGGQPDFVAKLYHGTVDLALYERKLTAMLALTPELPDLFEGGKRYVQLAWPRALLRDAGGRFVGYLMPAVDVKATSELECVLQEKQARRLGLPTGLGAKVTLAANLAGVIAELHRQQHRVVDLKPVNLRFYPSSLYMAMLDCDGFSIQGRGERFEAPQITIDYLAPEFQLGGLLAAGEEAQDRFALAVVVFQLLNFGIHPFTGRPEHEHVPTDVPSRISARLYAYGQRAHPQLSPSPVSGHASMPADLRQLFDRAFEGAGNARPSALEWSTTLRAYAQRASLRLATCTRVDEHQHFAGLPCAACARSALLARTARGNAQPDPARAPVAPRTPGRSGFGLRRPVPVLAAAAKRNAATPIGPPSPPRPRRARIPIHFPPASLPTRGAFPLPPPMPAWAHTPARRWFVQRWRNVSSDVKAFLFIIVLVVVLIQGKRMVMHLEDLLGTPSPPAVNIYATDPANRRSYPPQPAAPVQPDAIAPITARSTEDLRFGPPNWSDTEATRQAAQLVAAGAAGQDPKAVDDAMRRLERLLRKSTGAGAAQRAHDQLSFLSFAAATRTLGPRDRQRSLRGLAEELERNPYDAERACEWSWLALLEGRRELAHDGFVRTIWADPQYSCGWLGLGVLEEDDAGSYGALVMAERLQLGEGRQFDTRDALVEAAIGADTHALQRWRVLDARARLRNEDVRRQPVPPEIRQRAKAVLPARPEASPPAGVPPG